MSDCSTDAMLPAHEGPLPIFPAPLAGQARRLRSESARHTYFPPRMPQAVCPLKGIWTSPQPLQYVFLPRNWMTNRRGTDRNIEHARLTCMTASRHLPNQLLQMLDAAEFDLLRPHLATVEMVRETVLGEAGTALPHATVREPCVRDSTRPDCTPVRSSDVPRSDILSQLPIYPDGKMMELARPGSGFTCRDPLLQERGGSFGNDGAPIQRFPVRTAGGRL